MTKVKDLAVKVSEYTDRNGQQKARWENVGSIMRGDNGNEFILLNRHFNPAGIANPDNRESVLISMFEPKQNSGNDGGF